MEQTIRVGENRSQPDIILSAENLQMLRGSRSVDLISDELSVDTLEVEVRQSGESETLVDAEGQSLVTDDGQELALAGSSIDVSGLKYARPMWLYHNYSPVAKYYVERVRRTGRNVYRIEAVSVVGMLGNISHKGGMYSGEKLINILAELLGDGSIGEAQEKGGYYVRGGYEDFYVPPEIGDMQTYGQLPYATARDNLHQILLATGASIIREDEYGDLAFAYLQDLSGTEIVQGRIYLNGGETEDADVTGVSVTEHTFLWTVDAAEQEIYNNTDAYTSTAENSLVVFSSPILPSTVKVTGDLQVQEIGVNYAIVSGKGTLRAVPYLHITRELSRGIDAGGAPANIRRVSECTLISPLNSENVLERLADYYINAGRQNLSIILSQEKPGRLYSYTDGFGVSREGILSRLEYTASSISKGACQFRLGYNPKNFGNLYNHSDLLTGNGLWNVPSEVRSRELPYIRMTLVGAGSGGDGGSGGEAGRGCKGAAQNYDGYGGGPGGKGGKAGKAGASGKVLTLTLNVKDVAYLQYVCGVGGSGGPAGSGGTATTAATQGGIGSIGGETTVFLYDDNTQLIGQYNTTAGYILPSGIVDLVNGEIYALPGKAGTDGGNGGTGGAAAYGSNGGDGGDVERDGEVYAGGSGSASYQSYVEGPFGGESFAGGAGGGGAAVGTPGQAAKSDAVNLGFLFSGGDGGDGATPEAMTDADHYGQGGDGGDGGGGGGSGGAQSVRPLSESRHDGFPGNGGSGSPGGRGGDGCGFIYW